MKTALTRCLRHGLYYLALMFFVMMMTAIGLLVFFPLFMPKGFFSSSSAFYMVAAFFPFCSFFMSVSWFSTISKQMISYNISRKTFYLSSLFVKTGYAFVSAAILSIATIVIYDSIPVAPALLFLLIFISLFVLECLGDFNGILTARYGKIGVIVYFIIILASTTVPSLCIAFYSFEFKALFLTAFSSLFSPTAALISVAIATALTIINWFFFKALEIES